MWQLRKITDFPSPPSTLVSHGYPHRLHPPPPAPAPSPVNPLRSLNTLTCTYTTCEHTRAQKNAHRFMQEVIHASVHSLTHRSHLPPSQSSSYLAAKSSHGNALVNLPLCSLVLINRFKWKYAVKWHRALVLVSESPPPFCRNSPVTLSKPALISHLTFFLFTYSLLHLSLSSVLHNDHWLIWLQLSTQTSLFAQQTGKPPAPTVPTWLVGTNAYFTTWSLSWAAPQGGITLNM